MRPRSKKNALPLVLLVLPVLTGCATSSRLVVRGDEAAKRGDHGAAAANYDAAFGSESLDKPEVKAEVTRKRNEEVSLLAFVNGGADRYGSDEDEGYAVPFAFYASGEARLRYVVTAPWVIEGGFAYVARATSDPSGPLLRPAGAGPGEEASKEYRGDVRILFRHWYLGGQYMSFVDASAVGGSIGKLF
jgi:hypothetical protein